MRVKVEYRTSSRDSYKDFCQKNPNIKLTYDEWRNIIYEFNDSFRVYILETGELVKLPYGFGEFTINKKKRKKIKTSPEGKNFINLPVDWKRTKEKGKKIYQFNYHTEGYYFGWHWVKNNARLKMTGLWYFKPCRTTSRLLSHYINIDEKYKHMYCTWKI